MSMDTERIVLATIAVLLGCSIMHWAGGVCLQGWWGSYTSAYSEIPELLERDLVLDDDAGIVDTPGSPCNPRKATDG